MNWTDREKKLRRCFQSKLTPAAENLRARGVELFPLGPDLEPSSWWEVLAENEADFIELEPQGFGVMLKERWDAAGMPELAALAGTLMDLANQLEIDQSTDEELSPFVYVMY